MRTPPRRLAPTRRPQRARALPTQLLCLAALFSASGCADPGEEPLSPPHSDGGFGYQGGRFDAEPRPMPLDDWGPIPGLDAGPTLDATRPLDAAQPLDRGVEHDAAQPLDQGIEHDAAQPLDQGVEPDQSVDPWPPDPGLNAGWIGGPCQADGDCDYPDGYCLREPEGYPRGLCAQDCTRLCPDQSGAPATFCVDGLVVGAGACIQQCDVAAFGGNGCRPGYSCTQEPRYNEPGTTRNVCLPEGARPRADCLSRLDDLGLNFEPSGNARANPPGMPNVVCDVVDAIRLSSPVMGVNYRYVSHDTPQPMYMRCSLAHALVRLSELLLEYDLVEVGHIGTYNCRGIAGSNSPSEHGQGHAIDLAWFRKANGEEYNVLNHWEKNTTSNFRTEKGRVLYEIAEQMHERRIFNIILTPNYNSAHDNHFHVDLKPGSHFLRSTGIDDLPAAPIDEPFCGHLDDEQP